MRIKQIHIKHLKAIKDLEIQFNPDNDVTLIYGNNGVGKTTVLEAISLIGHISSMRRFSIPPGISNLDEYGWESKFLEEDADKEGITFQSEPFKYLRETLLKCRSLEDWFKEFNGEQKAAAIYYKLEHRLPDLEEKELDIYIYFKQATSARDSNQSSNMSNRKPLSITQALSRGSSDDVEMNNLFALVYSEKYEKDIELLTRHFYENCAHFVRSKERDKGKGIIRKTKKPGEGSHLVSYINTDLNDFGRKNDIRESVKNMVEHFGAEMLWRLALPFDGGKTKTEFKYRESLNLYLDDVIRDYANVHPSAARDGRHGQLFQLEEISCCQLSEDSAEFKLALWARRIGEEAQEIDHMSAGENECFFIFMLLLGLPIEQSIILFDEPDLHLTTFAKDTFYRALFQLLRDRDCQVIISTHSLFAYSATEVEGNGDLINGIFNYRVKKKRGEGVDRKLIERVEENGRWVHKETDGHEFFRKLHLHYLETARKALKVFDTKEFVKFTILGWRDRIEQNSRLFPGLAGLFGEALFTLIQVFIPLFIGLVLAFLNDAFNPDQNSHLKWAHRIVWTSLSGTAIWGVLFFFLRKSRSTGRK